MYGERNTFTHLRLMRADRNRKHCCCRTHMGRLDTDQSANLRCGGDADAHLLRVRRDRNADHPCYRKPHMGRMETEKGSVLYGRR